MQYLTDRVFRQPGAFAPNECRDLIDLALTHGFESAQVRTHHGSQALPHIRNNQRAQFPNVMWVAELWSRVQSWSLPVLEGERPIGLPRDLRFYAYAPGQRFKMHKDGAWLEDGQVSRLTLLVYLNDDFEGGGTDFRDFVVSPRTGDALLFVHDTWHEGQTVLSGTKYVLRSDVLYG